MVIHMYLTTIIPADIIILPADITTPQAATRPADMATPITGDRWPL